jgi:predicted Fe-Mo cluster-binding NifX family protein
VVIASQLSPGCRLALQALSVAPYLAPQGSTVREAIELYERGELEEVGP